MVDGVDMAASIVKLSRPSPSPLAPFLRPLLIRFPNINRVTDYGLAREQMKGDC